MAKKKKESKEIKPIARTEKANELIQNTIDNKEKLCCNRILDI